MKLTKGIAVTLTAAILASGGGLATTIATAPAAYAASTQTEIDAAIQQILTETNAERAKAGLEPLIITPSISRVAQSWTQQMATKQSMTHNPGYSDGFPKPWLRAGENVGQGYTTSTIVAAWMASEGHRKNILGDFTHIGLGYWVDDFGRAWFTQNFAKYEVPSLTAINTPEFTVGKHDVSASWLAKWDEPADSYKAELYSSTGTLLQTKTVPTPTVSFTGLADLTSYTVNIVSQKTDAPGFLHVSPVSTYNVTTLEDSPTVTAPTNLTLAPTENSVAASWGAPDVYGTLQPYKVELKSGTTVVKSAETTAPNYTFTGLPSDTAYTVNVTATSALNGKSVTAVATQTTRTVQTVAAPNPPVLAAPVVAHDTVDISWSAPTGVIGDIVDYTVTLKEAGKEDRSFNAATGTSHEFTGLTENTSYTIEVAANVVSKDGTREATSPAASVTVKTPYAPSAVKINPVTGLTLSNVTYNSLTASWTAPTGTVGTATGYLVILKKDGVIVTNRVVTTPSTTFGGLTDSSNYTVEVAALASSADRTATATSAFVGVAVTTPAFAAAPNAPTNFRVVTSASDKATLAWDTPTGVYGNLKEYRLRLSETGKADRYFTSLTNSFEVTGLTESTSYTVQVSAYVVSRDGTRTALSPLATTALNTPAPADIVAVSAPTGLQVSAVTANSMMVSWNPPTGTLGNFVGYTVTVKQGASVVQTHNFTGTSMPLTGLTSNTAYTIEVAANAVSGDGLTKATSTAATVTATTIKSAVVSVAAPVVTLTGVGSDRMTVNWSKPAVTGTLTGYKVLVKQGTTVMKTVPVAATGTGTAVTGLTEKTTYTVVVEATAVAENGVATATTASAARGVTTPLSAASTVSVGVPSLLVTTATSTGPTTSTITATWVKPAVTGTLTNYTVTVKQGTTVVKTVVVAATTPKAVITGLREKTAYTVSVVANASSSNLKYKASSAAAVKSISTPTSPASAVSVGVPTYLATSSTTNSVTATWRKPAVVGTVTGYTVSLMQGTRVIRTATVAGLKATFGTLPEKTGYTVSVRANATSANRLYKATSGAAVKAITTQTTAASKVSIGAPSVTLSSTRNNLTAVWTRPAVVGTVTGYTVTVKQGTRVVGTYSTTGGRVTFFGLAANTPYTVSVTAKAKSANGRYFASATTTKVIWTKR